VDKDGIGDDADECPLEAEDPDGFEDENGCPDPDNDGDGVLDGSDKCPQSAEDVDQFEDADGCPEIDNDGDGIVDVQDQCPQVAELFNGVDDSDGCPDEGKQLLVFDKGKIQLLEKIRFRTGKDKIIGKESFKILDAVVAVMTGRPDIEVRIEGHTDNVGKRDKNVRLSERRAIAVLRYLVEREIDPDRLTAVGHGPDKPLESNKTRKGKAANRRVEFVITNQ
jgi:outer membrane protein OmpA-like peptidoglycan-associated protein